jgi:hypothetical protein
MPAMVARNVGVSMTLGQIAFTRTPLGPYSRAAVLVSCSSPALAAAKCAKPGAAATAKVAETFTTAPPPPWTMSGIACFIIRNGPLRLTRMTARSSPRRAPSAAAPRHRPPAQLNRASRRP